MKILYVVNSASMDGASISFLNLLEGVRKKGIECHVVIPNKSVINNYFIEKLNALNVVYYIVPVYFSIFSTKISKWRKFQLLMKTITGVKLFYRIKSRMKLYFLIKSIKPDIVHTNVGIIHDPFLLCKKMGIRHIWHLREYQDLDFNWKILPSFHAFCHMLQHSEVITITNDIRKHFHLEMCSNALTIYNGIFNRADTQLLFPKEKYFLCASRISKEKGLYDVINAFAIFYKKHKDYRLLIAGSGSEEYLNTLKRLVDNLQCSDAVAFLGYCKDVRPLMQRAKALVVASYYEAFGRMTAEAAFCGCLVIGRNTGGTKEILDYIGGIVFEGGFELLADKMENVMQMSNEKYLSIVSYAQKKAIRRYSNETYVESILQIYKKKYL